MLYTRNLYLLSLLFTLSCLIPFQARAQLTLEEIVEDDQHEKAYERPKGVGGDLGPNALRFFFLAATPVKRDFYYLEDGEYRVIRAAFDTFGDVHRVTKRAKLELCKKSTRIVGGKEVVDYVPQFELDVSNRRDLFAVFLPSVNPSSGEVYKLNAIDFSDKMFPYNKYTFINILPKPLMVVLGDEKAVVQPGQVLRSSYSIRRKGVGYLRVALAIRDVGGDAKLLYNRLLPGYQDERSIAIPIFDPWGGEGIKVLSYRDNGVAPE